MISKIKDLIRKDWQEIVYGISILPLLKDEKTINRFNCLKNKYEDIYKSFYLNNINLDNNSTGYDWSDWSGEIRGAFKSSVPLDFLSIRHISFTMVFKRLSGVKETSKRIELIETFLESSDTSKLLEEDYIGGPNIANSKYKTSANRAHHASHLASYKK